MRYVYATLGLFVIIGALAGVKVTQIKTLIGFGEAMAKVGPPPEAVTTAPAKEIEWDNELTAVGTIAPERGVTLSNDAAGVVKAIKFESGAVVKKGQVLLELDSDLERAQLSSAIARRDLARVSVQRSRALVAGNALSRSQLDADEAELKSATADVAALQAQIDRKIVRAPFAGRLGIREVNLGQFLNPGTPLTELQATEAMYVDFTLPQQVVERLAVGMRVRLAEGAEGAIAAIEPTVDPTSRSVRVRATVEGANDKIHPGMFVNVSVVLPEQQRFVVVPAEALVHASYGDSVFIVEQGKARQQFVKTGDTRGDYVAIVDGVKPGQQIVVAGAFKLRNGASVVVNDSVKHVHQLTPRPENR